MNIPGKPLIPRISSKGMSVKDQFQEIHPAGDVPYLRVWPGDIDYDTGRPIYIRVAGMKGEPTDRCECNILIEFYDGKAQVHIWNGSEDATTVAIDMKPTFKKAIEAPTEDLPLLIAEMQDDPDALELIERRLKG